MSQSLQDVPATETPEPEPAAPVQARWNRRTRFFVWFAALWVAYLVAHLVFSGVSYLFLLFDLLPPPAYLLVGVILIVAGVTLRAARRYVLTLAVAAILLSANLTGLNPHAVFGGGDGAAPAGSLKIFSWNTEYWDQYDSPDQFYDFLKAQNADVYLLQEYIFWDNTMNAQCLPTGPRSAGDLLRLKQVFPGYTVTTRGELLTLSRLPVVATPPVAPDWGRLPVEDWTDVYTNVKVLRTDVKVGDRILSIYNTHMPVQLGEHSLLTLDFLKDVAFADTARRDQFEGVHDDIAANRNPVLLAGDFNTSPSMGDMHWITSVADDALRANRDLYPYSWRSRSTVNAFPMPLWRLDWAFTAHGVKVHDYDFMPTERMSDHRAQSLSISL
ncbi:endonuclease/exonuclease/phosphatase family protein [Hamadaea tsunoensis]|uniref:endonuclease/exonuclease/phosphatase family protein n=1 Tax=Hamadaea tsunoensis TaxID=53368 RepID=UPI000407DD37|nr:endonuclease/exonuclease/phosphatase family protein [Hamadaea tsunoensis]